MAVEQRLSVSSDTPPIAVTPAVRPAALGRTVVSIQFLRFVAAFAVVLFHAHQAIARGVYDHPPALHYAFGLGAAGVHIFFCISGFVMVYTSYCHDAGPFAPGDFLLKRALRIYPIYWLCCAAYLLFHVATHSAYPVTLSETLGALALLPGDAPAIIGPAWTLTFEVYFYLCFAIIMIAGFRAGLIALTGFFLSCMVLPIVAHVRLFPIMSNSLLLEFVAGAWLGRFAITRPTWLAATWPIALLLGVGGFAVGYMFGYDRLPSALIWGVPSLFLLTGTIGMEAAGRLPKTMAHLAFLGDGSYFLYLSHILLIDVLLLTPLAWLRDTTDGIIVATVIAATMIAAVSVPAFLWLERPMLRRLRRWTRRA